MYWGAGKAKDGSIYGASDTKKGGSDVCATIKASYRITYKSQMDINVMKNAGCSITSLSSDCCENGDGCKINTDFGKHLYRWRKR